MVPAGTKKNRLRIHGDADAFSPASIDPGVADYNWREWRGGLGDLDGMMPALAFMAAPITIAAFVVLD